MLPVKSFMLRHCLPSMSLNSSFEYGGVLRAMRDYYTIDCRAVRWYTEFAASIFPRYF